jgi:hypothetical protein
VYAEAASRRTYTWDEVHPAYRQDYGNLPGTVIEKEKDRDDDDEEKNKEEVEIDNEEKERRDEDEEKDETMKKDMEVDEEIEDRETDKKNEENEEMIEEMKEDRDDDEENNEEKENEDDNDPTPEPVDIDNDNVCRVDTVMSPPLTLNVDTPPTSPPDICEPTPFPPSPNIDTDHPSPLHYAYPPSYLSIPDTAPPLPFPPSPNIPISHLHFADPPPHLDISDMVPPPPLPLKPNLPHMFYCRRPRANVTWRGPGVCRHLSYFILHILPDDLLYGLIVSVFLLVSFFYPHYTLLSLLTTVFGSEFLFPFSCVFLSFFFFCRLLLLFMFEDEHVLEGARCGSACSMYLL